MKPSTSQVRRLQLACLGRNWDQYSISTLLQPYTTSAASEPEAVTAAVHAHDHGDANAGSSYVETCPKPASKQRISLHSPAGTRTQLKDGRWRCYRVKYKQDLVLPDGAQKHMLPWPMGRRLNPRHSPLQCIYAPGPPANNSKQPPSPSLDGPSVVRMTSVVFSPKCRQAQVLVHTCSWVALSRPGHTSNPSRSARSAPVAASPSDHRILGHSDLMWAATP